MAKKAKIINGPERPNENWRKSESKHHWKRTFFWLKMLSKRKLNKMGHIASEAFTGNGHIKECQYRRKERNNHWLHCLVDCISYNVCVFVKRSWQKMQFLENATVCLSLDKKREHLLGAMPSGEAPRRGTLYCCRLTNSETHRLLSLFSLF